MPASTSVRLIRSSLDVHEDQFLPFLITAVAMVFIDLLRFTAQEERLRATREPDAETPEAFPITFPSSIVRKLHVSCNK
jgi:hypothetical protein